MKGHAIGRLDGFTFAPDAAEAGSDAKALQAAAQQVLASEIDARATKLAAAPDDQLVLTSDGTIRWTGDAVAKLVAADDALHPRLRIIADDRLSGAPREAVQARLDLWLKTHIEKLLGPLFGSPKAEDITGIGRGIAFQLVEALGVLERAKISAEMKDLDQASRATLRKYGVRFGAYHIYFPGTLEARGAPRWRRCCGPRSRTMSTCRRCRARSIWLEFGRTSFPVDKALQRDAYRVLGYRQCGRARAVRVDILERLCRSHSSRFGVARNLARRKADRRVRRPRLRGDAGDDLADRLGRRGLCLDPARARLSHGPPPAIAAEARARGAWSRRCRAETPPVEGEVPKQRRGATSETPAEEVAAELPVVRRSRAVGFAAAPMSAPLAAAARRASRLRPKLHREPVEAAPEPAAGRRGRRGNACGTGR